MDYDAPCIVKGSNIAIKIPKKINKDLAYIIGMLRDGTVVRESHNEYLFALYSKDKEFVKHTLNFYGDRAG